MAINPLSTQHRAGFAAGVLVLAASAAACRAQSPEGWGSVGPGAANCDCVVDDTVHHGGKYSCRIESRQPRQEEFAMVTQMFQARPYRGKRVRLSGYIKTEALSGDARLWVLLSNDDAVLARDNMGERAVKGTTDWTEGEIVVDVPPDAEYFQIALLVGGKGKAWFDDLKLETVGKDVRTTIPRQPPLPYPQRERKKEVGAVPVNLDFEKGAASP